MRICASCLFYHITLIIGPLELYFNIQLAKSVSLLCAVFGFQVPALGALFQLAKSVALWVPENKILGIAH